MLEWSRATGEEESEKRETQSGERGSRAALSKKSQVTNPRENEELRVRNERRGAIENGKRKKKPLDLGLKGELIGSKLVLL